MHPRKGGGMCVRGDENVERERERGIKRTHQFGACVEKYE